MATGCTAEAACQAGSGVARQNRQDLMDWDDGEDLRWGIRRDLRDEAQTLVHREGSCRMEFGVRWKEVARTWMKGRWGRWRA